MPTGEIYRSQMQGLQPQAGRLPKSGIRASDVLFQSSNLLAQYSKDSRVLNFPNYLDISIPESAERASLESSKRSKS